MAESKKAESQLPLKSRAALNPEQLRWSCDPASLRHDSTLDVEPIPPVVGQDDAIAALRYGISSRGPGLNLYVRGLEGSERGPLIKHLLEQSSPRCKPALDRCYVHNFEDPQRPSLISLPRGQALPFQRRVDEVIDFIRSELKSVVESEGVRAARSSLDEKLAKALKKVGQPFDDELRANELAIMMPSTGSREDAVISPLIDGKPVGPGDIAQLRREEKLSAEELEEIERKIATFAERFEAVSAEMDQLTSEHRDQVRELLEVELKKAIRRRTMRVLQSFKNPSVDRFLAGIVDDAVHSVLSGVAAQEDFTRRYRVNVLSYHQGDDGCPVIVESAPGVRNLLGGIDQPVTPERASDFPHMLIRGGSLLRADGGYLIVEAHDLISERGAWKVLVRTLRSQRLEIAPAELQWPFGGPQIQPEHIPLDVKIILIGSAEIYYILDANDPDFPLLFKILVDFDSVVPNDADGIEHYAGVLAELAKKEGLPPFDRSAIAALSEQGARIAARQDRLSTDFGRLSDIAREASSIAAERQAKASTRDDVREAVRRGRRRADLPARRFREYIADGTIQIQTQGSVIGQINGLAVVKSGPLTYGFPSRITATIGPGNSGAVNIERESRLSGAIHTKGFYILGGLLRHLLRTKHPMAFSASVAFEQSYGGIDGDSASGAEICCLLSALTQVPISQGIGMTGAIDQHGHIQAVGAVTEKIEGFYNACATAGLSGDQGVIIPRSTVKNLMLHPEVVQAAQEGRFTIYAVNTIHEALEILCDRPAGDRDEDGEYPEGSILRLAIDEAALFWLKARDPAAFIAMEDEDEDEEAAAE